jgi:glycosyltransferase involved in cell wall biosynthesis
MEQHWARFPVQERGMKLVIIIPALNEATTIQNVLAAVPDAIAGIEAVETLVVDDGSTDATAELARASGAVVVSHGQTLGLGSAFRTGVDAALARGADLIVNIDGDGQFNPADIPKLITPLLAGKADFVTCTRFGEQPCVPKVPWIKRMGNRAVCSIVNWITGQSFTDVSCGFRAYSRDTALRLNLFGDFTYTQETFIDLAGKRARMAEVPLLVKGEREHGRSRMASNLVRYAFHSFFIMLRAARDLNPMKFFGSIGLAVFGVGFVLGAFVLGHWLNTGRTSPYTQFLTGSAVGLILGFLLLVLALIADMLGRQRRGIEDLLYLRRKETTERERKDSC